LKRTDLVPVRQFLQRRGEAAGDGGDSA
jgi:hypothetical protein